MEESRAGGRLLPGVNANIVDEHLLRENRGVVGGAGPIAANSQIQNEKEWVIECPVAGRRPSLGPKRGIETGIKVEADRPWFPFDSVEVVIISQFLAFGQAED